MAATAQKEGKIVYWIPLEPFDPIRAAQFGINLDEMMIGQFPQAEQALDTIVDYTRDKLVDLIVLDSIHSLAPKGMQENSKGEKSLSEETMAIRPVNCQSSLRLPVTLLESTNLLLIGQTRMKVGFITIEAFDWW